MCRICIMLHLYIELRKLSPGDIIICNPTAFVVKYTHDVPSVHRIITCPTVVNQRNLMVTSTKLWNSRPTLPLEIIQYPWHWSIHGRWIGPNYTPDLINKILDIFIVRRIKYYFAVDSIGYLVVIGSFYTTSHRPLEQWAIRGKLWRIGMLPW